MSPPLICLLPRLSSSSLSLVSRSPSLPFCRLKVNPTSKACLWKVVCSLYRPPEALHLSSFCCSFFLSLPFLVFIRSAVPHSAAVAESTHKHAHAQNDAHKTHCSTAKWMPGWESQMLCYFISANTISGDAVPTREPQGAPGPFSEIQTITQANCSVVSLCPSFFHYGPFLSTSQKLEWFCVCANSNCVCVVDLLCRFDNANQGQWTQCELEE